MTGTAHDARRLSHDVSWPALVMFDLDGTLVDTVPDLSAALNAALQECELPEADESRCRGWVGGGTEQLVRQALAHVTGGVDEVLFERVYAAFERAYEARVFTDSRLYPQVPQTLAALAQTRLLACVTNKPARFTSPLLSACGLAWRFAAVVCGDTIERRKPDPAPLLHAACALGIEPGACVMVGDSNADIDAAQRAGMSVVHATYGYVGDERAWRTCPDASVERFAEIPAALEALPQPMNNHTTALPGSSR